VTSFVEQLATFRSHLKLDADGSISYFGSIHIPLDTTASLYILQYPTEKVGLGIKNAEEQIYEFSKEHPFFHKLYYVFCSKYPIAPSEF
jgi:hypothetical protein